MYICTEFDLILLVIMEPWVRLKGQSQTFAGPDQMTILWSGGRDSSIEGSNNNILLLYF